MHATFEAMSHLLWIIFFQKWSIGIWYSMTGSLNHIIWSRYFGTFFGRSVGRPIYIYMYIYIPQSSPSDRPPSSQATGGWALAKNRSCIKTKVTWQYKTTWPKHCQVAIHHNVITQPRGNVYKHSLQTKTWPRGQPRFAYHVGMTSSKICISN